MKTQTAAGVFMLLVSSLTSVIAGAAELEVSAQPLRSTQGHLIYSLYANADAWNSDHETHHGQVNATGGTVTFTIHDLQPGTYALSIFHDENGNGKHDTDFLGRPTEMFGISNINRTLWSKPGWDEVHFEVKTDQVNRLPILLKWQ